jgi:hypothetical protein
MSAIKFIPLGAIHPLHSCYIGKAVGNWLEGFRLSRFGQYAVYGVAHAVFIFMGI